MSKTNPCMSLKDVLFCLFHRLSFAYVPLNSNHEAFNHKKRTTKSICKSCQCRILPSLLLRLKNVALQATQIPPPHRPQQHNSNSLHNYNMPQIFPHKCPTLILYNVFIIGTISSFSVIYLEDNT